jgi:hypothetical protein
MTIIKIMIVTTMYLLSTTIYAQQDTVALREVTVWSNKGKSLLEKVLDMQQSVPKELNFTGVFEEKVYKDDTLVFDLNMSIYGKGEYDKKHKNYRYYSLYSDLSAQILTNSLNLSDSQITEATKKMENSVIETLKSNFFYYEAKKQYYTPDYPMLYTKMLKDMNIDIYEDSLQKEKFRICMTAYKEEDSIFQRVIEIEVEKKNSESKYNLLSLSFFFRPSEKQDISKINIFKSYRLTHKNYYFYYVKIDFILIDNLIYPNHINQIKILDISNKNREDYTQSSCLVSDRSLSFKHADDALELNYSILNLIQDNILTYSKDFINFNIKKP